MIIRNSANVYYSTTSKRLLTLEGTTMSENLYDEKHDEAADKHGAPTTHGDTGGAPLSGDVEPAGYDEAAALQGKPFGTEEIGSGMDWKRER